MIEVIAVLNSMSFAMTTPDMTPRPFFERLSVCTGSALLAKAGLLDGMPATSNKMFFELARSQGPRVDWQESARWVDAGHVTENTFVRTSSGEYLQPIPIEGPVALLNAGGTVISRELADFAEKPLNKNKLSKTQTMAILDSIDNQLRWPQALEVLMPALEATRMC